MPFRLGRVRPVAFGRGTIEAALARDYGEENLGELEVTLEEVTRATSAVLRFAGFPTGPRDARSCAGSG